MSIHQTQYSQEEQTDLRVEESQRVGSEDQPAPVPTNDPLFYVWYLLYDSQRVTNNVAQTFSKICQASAINQLDLNEGINQIKLSNLTHDDLYEKQTIEHEHGHWMMVDQWTTQWVVDSVDYETVEVEKKPDATRMQQISLDNTQAQAERSYQTNKLLQSRQNDQVNMSKVSLMTDASSTSQTECSSVMDLLTNLTPVIVKPLGR